MAEDKFSCSRIESISVINWLRLSFFSSEMLFSASKNSSSSEMLVWWRLAMTTESFSFIFAEGVNGNNRGVAAGNFGRSRFFFVVFQLFAGKVFAQIEA